MRPDPAPLYPARRRWPALPARTRWRLAWGYLRSLWPRDTTLRLESDAADLAAWAHPAADPLYRAAAALVLETRP